MRSSLWTLWPIPQCAGLRYFWNQNVSILAHSFPGLFLCVLALTVCLARIRPVSTSPIFVARKVGDTRWRVPPFCSALVFNIDRMQSLSIIPQDVLLLLSSRKCSITRWRVLFLSLSFISFRFDFQTSWSPIPITITTSWYFEVIGDIGDSGTY